MMFRPKVNMQGCLHIYGTNLSSTEINVEKDGGFYEEINKKDIGRCERDYTDYRLFVSSDGMQQ
jgi:hypothetical protein